MSKYIKTIVMAAVAVLAVAFPFYTGAYPQSIAQSVLTYMILAVSWDMLLRTGQISFGIAGFFGIGSYAAVLSMLYLNLPPMLTILIGGIIAGAIAGLLGIAVLRLRGMYFAIVTLAVAEIFRIIMTNLKGFTGGPEGELLPQLIFQGNPYLTYYLMFGMAVLTIIISEIFLRSRVHYALTAIRNDEIVARSSGVNIFKYLVIIFIVTSVIQGMTGGINAQTYGFVTPESSFSLDYTLLPLAMALLGGIYGTMGPVVGALLLGIVSEYLKLYIPYGHLVIYGIIVVIVILYMPQGIVGLAARIRKAGARNE
ncbi:MAG: branched-chain amino acid ABC transporter permease [Spirochaetales bacterium]|nr:branched-chain amino acid ABC transporter permease [Spirochaetales bacterium]MCF7939224.1 branched-chain amino acid ABC transporter permease [Spirochaetales bacterium]